MRVIFKIIIWLAVLASLLLLAARIAAGMRETEALDDAMPEQGQLIDTDEGAIFILSQGPQDAPMLLFAHGTAAWSGLWAPTLQNMGQKDWHAVAFDMPPFGYSQRAEDRDYSRARQAERILALVRALETKPILVAHSIGAGPGVEAVMQRPDAFAGLIVVDGALGLGSHENARGLPFPLRLAPVRDSVTALTVTNPWLTRTFLRGLIHVKEAATPEIAQLLTQPFHRVGTTRSYSDWLPSLLVPPRDALSTRAENYAKMDLPVVYIWGEKDTVTPLSQGKTLADLTPDARLLTLPDSGHIPQIETPQAFILALDEALGLIAQTTRP